MIVEKEYILYIHSIIGCNWNYVPSVLFLDDIHIIKILYNIVVFITYIFIHLIDKATEKIAN